MTRKPRADSLAEAPITDEFKQGIEIEKIACFERTPDSPRDRAACQGNESEKDEALKETAANRQGLEAAISRSRKLSTVARYPLERELLTENSLSHLLQPAGVSPLDEKAAAWLSEAIKGARASHRAAKQRPLPGDNNDLLADIEKSAKELIKGIERLRRHPVSWHAFWRSDAFGPVHLDRVEVCEALSALERIVRAAGTAKDRGKGRRRKVGKQHVVDLAFAFFVRYSAQQASGTATGAFATFARAFYTEVTGVDPEKHGGLDRQIRQAARRLPIERQRAQRKSVERSRDPS
jgi:hypothetical protein